MPKQIDEDLLIDAAVEVFAERGYDGAGVAEIARRAGVTTGAIYSRYSGKSELLLEAINRSFARHIGEILAMAIEDSNNLKYKSGFGPLGLIGDMTEKVSTTHEALFLEAVVASSRDEKIATMINKRIENGAVFISKRIDALKANGRVSSQFDTDALKTYIIAMSLGFSILRAVNYKMPAKDDWQQVIKLTQDGIRNVAGETNDNN